MTSRTSRTPVLLGLDLGSSSLKAMLVDLTGRVIAAHSVGYPTLTPCPGGAEQNVDDWWSACGEATRTVLSQFRTTEVVGIGLSGQMHTFVLLDSAGVPVRPAITWMDTRAACLLPDIKARIDESRIAAELANPAVVGLTLPPLLWLRDHEPEALARARVLLLAKDALRHRLTGELASETTDASATLLFDVAGRTWSAPALEAFAFPTALFPPISQPDEVAGVLSPNAALHLHLPAGIPVAFGAGDQQAAAVGTGTIIAGDAQLMVGTGAQALVVEDTAPEHAGHGLHVFCHVRGWLRQASVNNAGVALDWARTVLGLGWEEMYAALGDAPPPTAPIFIPYLTGERAPLMKGHARGGWLGLEPRHDRSTLARAAVAGVVVGIANGLTALPSRSSRRVRAGGGGLQRPAFAQAVADASGAGLDLVDASHASAMGAALLGGIASGVFTDIEAAVRVAKATASRNVNPRPDRARDWEALRRRFTAIDAIGLHEALAAS